MTSPADPAVSRRSCRQPVAPETVAGGSGRSGKPAPCRTTHCERSKTACIAAAIAKQEDIGLRAATDGEYRRAYWHYDFVAGLDGVEIYEPEQKILFKGGVPLAHMLRVNGRIGWSKPMMIDRLPVPRQSHVRDGGAETDDPVAIGRAFPRRTGGDRPDHLSNAGRFFADLGVAYHKAVAAFGAAGCRYLQLDEVNIAYLCDPEQIADAEGARRACRQSAAASTPTC